MTHKDTFLRAKAASRSLAMMTDKERNDVLRDVADAIAGGKERLPTRPTWHGWTRPTRCTTGSS